MARNNNILEKLGIVLNESFIVNGKMYRVSPEGESLYPSENFVKLEVWDEDSERWKAANSLALLAGTVNSDNPFFIWSDRDKRDAEAVRRLFPDAEVVERGEHGNVYVRSNTYSIAEINKEMFPSLGAGLVAGKDADLDTILEKAQTE